MSGETAERPREQGGGPVFGERDAPLGGQAVLEGVMMRGVSTWAVAVRLPVPDAPPVGANGASVNGTPTTDGLPLGEPPLGEIEITSEPTVSWARGRISRLPVVRGVVALGDSLRIGYKALGISAQAQLAADEEELSSGAWTGTVIFATLFAVGLFFVVPVLAANFLRDFLPNAIAFVIAEKVIRISIFLAYLWLLSRSKELQRVFEYHGAEHKAIHCYESGLDLTPANAQRFSRFHPRCGTSFLLLVMIIAVVVFAPLGRPEWPILVASRIIGIPLIAGLSFEVLKAFGRNRQHRWARILMWPGIQLQRLTTREPSLDQLAVAIAALDAVRAAEGPGEAKAAGSLPLSVAAGRADR